MTQHPSIDHSLFPHILDAVVAAAVASDPASAWRTWRATSRAWRDRLDAITFAHVIVSPSDDDDVVTIDAVPNGTHSSGVRIRIASPSPPSLLSLARTVDVCGRIRADHATHLQRAFPCLETLRLRSIAGSYTDFCALSSAASRVVVFGTPTPARPPYPAPSPSLKRIVVHACASFGASFLSQAVPRYGRREVVLTFAGWAAAADGSPETSWVRGTRGADIARTLARLLHGDDAGKCVVVDAERVHKEWLGFEMSNDSMCDTLASHVEAYLWEQVLPYGTPHGERAEAIEVALRNLRFLSVAEYTAGMSAYELEVETIE
ncbi:uncharacterized protein EHS24_009442 [Apiotrichum porosum]|uniref:Uncharacterized protein n=1 Tax=Apiotrichum porosum TaxID=105984 RepID=A0A427XM14_9TREE|nr:uncharacterized protein EHS24_009442 [Apiotrichum porosum]RSH79784.1 hypothetical protein EHS24_009442 [Apiotrichum porosum]